MGRSTEELSRWVRANPASWGAAAAALAFAICQFNGIDPRLSFAIAFVSGVVNWLLWRPGSLGPRWKDRAKKGRDTERDGEEEGPPAE